MSSSVLQYSIQGIQESIILFRCSNRDAQHAIEHRVRTHIANENSLFVERVTDNTCRSFGSEQHEIGARGESFDSRSLSQRFEQSLALLHQNFDRTLQHFRALQHELSSRQCKNVHVVGQLSLVNLTRNF